MHCASYMNNCKVVFREIYPTYEFLNSLALILITCIFKNNFNLLSFKTPNFKFDGYEVKFECAWRFMTLVLSVLLLLYKSRILLKKGKYWNLNNHGSDLLSRIHSRYCLNLSVWLYKFESSTLPLWFLA